MSDYHILNTDVNLKHIIITIILLLLLCGTASAWLSGYDYRMPIEINNTGDNLTDYQYNFTVNTASLVSASKMNANGSDCRITNVTDVLQEFWNETAFNSSSTKIWVNASSLVNTSNTTHYIYYGKSDASDVSDISATFDFGDDFSIDTLTRVTEPSNPTRTADDGWEGSVLCEQSDFNYSGEYISWYRGNASGTYEIGFENSTDGVSWTGYSGNPIISSVAVYAYVVQDGDCFYLFICDSAAGTGDMYLYNVTDYTNPVIMNSGNPVYTCSTTNTDWDYKIFNPGVAIDGDGRWHMLLEGQSNAGVFRLGYAYSNLTEMNWSKHRSSSYVIGSTQAGNPHLKYVPDRNALLSLHGSRPGTYWKIIASYANLSDDLSTSANWHTAPNFEISNAVLHIADPCLMSNFNATYPIMISYNYNQAQTYQCYYAASLNEFYDAIIIDTWNTHGTFTYNIADGILSQSATTGNYGILKSKTTHSMPHIIEARSKVGGDDFARLAFSTDTTSTSTNQVGFWWSHDSARSYVATYSGATGGVDELSPAMDRNNYHNYKVKWISGSDAKYYCDDDYKASRTTNIPTSALPAWLFLYGWAGGSNICYWDWVFVRQYDAIEPTSSLGSEESAPSGNDIVLGANKYGMLRKNVSSAETFNTIANGFSHDVCFTWWNSTGDNWESYWVGDSYNSAVSVPQNDSYFVLMDGTGETVSCSVASAGTIAIPIGWSCTYLRESTNKTLTAIKSDMGGNCADLYAWNHSATGTGAWTDTGSYTVLPNQGLLVNASAGFNWDGSVA